MTDQPMKCGTCDKPLTLAAPRYVHADGNTYRHSIRPVLADEEVREPAPTRPLTAEDNVALNAIADALTARFGFLPLSVRYDAAGQALRIAREEGYAMHGDVDMLPARGTEPSTRPGARFTDDGPRWVP